MRPLVAKFLDPAVPCEICARYVFAFNVTLLVVSPIGPALQRSIHEREYCNAMQPIDDCLLRARIADSHYGCEAPKEMLPNRPYLVNGGGGSEQSK